MGDRLLRKVIRTCRAALAQYAPTAHSERTSYCPSLPRFRVGLLNADRWSEAERCHLRSGCLYCGRVMSNLARILWHPPLFSLFLWHIEQPQVDEFEYVRLHLEEDGCQQCYCLFHSIHFTRWADQVASGTASLEMVREALNTTTCGFARLPMYDRGISQLADKSSPSGSSPSVRTFTHKPSTIACEADGLPLMSDWNPEHRQVGGDALHLGYWGKQRFCLSAISPAHGNLNGFLYESKGVCRMSVESHSLKNAGRVVQVELAGDRGHLEMKMPLLLTESNRAMGKYTLGNFQEVEDCLGSVCVALVRLQDLPSSSTVPSCSAAFQTPTNVASARSRERGCSGAPFVF